MARKSRKNRGARSLEYPSTLSLGEKLSLTIAALALVISVCSAIYQWKHNVAQLTTWLNVQIDHYWESKVIVIEPTDDFPSYHYRKKAKVTFSNEGRSATSIINWNFYLTSDVEENRETKTLKIWIPGIKPDLKGLDGNKDPLPLNLAPGESKSVVLEYSVGLSMTAYEQLPVEAKNGHPIDWRIIDRHISLAQKESSAQQYLVEFRKGSNERVGIRFSNFGTHAYEQN